MAWDKRADKLRSFLQTPVVTSLQRVSEELRELSEPLIDGLKFLAQTHGCKNPRQTPPIFSHVKGLITYNPDELEPSIIKTLECKMSKVRKVVHLGKVYFCLNAPGAQRSKEVS